MNKHTDAKPRGRGKPTAAQSTHRPCNEEQQVAAPSRGGRHDHYAQPLIAIAAAASDRELPGDYDSLFSIQEEECRYSYPREPYAYNMDFILAEYDRMRNLTPGVYASLYQAQDYTRPSQQPR